MVLHPYSQVPFKRVQYRVAKLNSWFFISTSLSFFCKECKQGFVPNKYHPNAKFCSSICSEKYTKEHLPNYQLNQRHKIKSEIFVLLGGKCVECGYNGIALQVDHVHNNGKEEIVRERTSSLQYWKFILRKIKEGSKDYQLMCPTCNMEKELLRVMKVSLWPKV